MATQPLSPTTLCSKRIAPKPGRIRRATYGLGTMGHCALTMLARDGEPIPSNVATLYSETRESSERREAEREGDLPSKTEALLFALAIFMTTPLAQRRKIRSQLSNAAQHGSAEAQRVLNMLCIGNEY